MKKNQVVKFWKELEESTAAKEVIDRYKNKPGWPSARTLERYSQALSMFKSGATVEEVSMKTSWSIRHVDKILSWWRKEFQISQNPKPENNAPTEPSSRSDRSAEGVEKNGSLGTLLKKLFNPGEERVERHEQSRIRPKVTEEQRLAALHMAIDEMELLHGHVDHVGLIESYLTGTSFSDYPCSHCGSSRFRAEEGAGRVAGEGVILDRERRRIRQEVPEEKRLAYLEFAQEEMEVEHGHIDLPGLNDSYMTGKLFTEDPCTICGGPRFQRSETDY